MDYFIDYIPLLINGLSSNNVISENSPSGQSVSPNEKGTHL